MAAFRKPGLNGFQILLIGAVLLSLVLSACAGTPAAPTATPAKASAPTQPAAATPAPKPPAPTAATPAPKPPAPAASTPVAKAPATDAAAEKARVDKLVEEAKKEGKLMVYTTLNDPYMDPLVAGFEKKYPFLKVDRYRANGDVVLQRIVAEARAGRQIADVHLSSSQYVYNAFKEKLFEPYVSPESRVYPAGAKDKDGHWIGVVMLEVVPSYNTNLVKKQDAPKSLQEMTDPKWQGKLVDDERNVVVLRAMMEILGEQKAIDLYKGIAKNLSGLRRGHTLISEQVAAGEIPVAVSIYRYGVLELQAKGAPIDWVPTNPIIADFLPMGVFAKAPHPSAAKLWTDYTLSVEGQQSLAEGGRVPVRPGIKLNPPALTEGLNFFWVDPAWGDRAEQDLKTFKDLYGIK
ncbi:MAG: extracellular solute-binding protein [Chloroflexi bacterium]|nr:extracellular solute-binding protein [Chloroflexota bacterium]